MTTKRKSKGLSVATVLALGVAGALLVSASTPAAAHKKHGSHQSQPKTPQNPGPVGPMPKPPASGPIVVGGWHATRQPVAVRDHRGGSGSTVTVTDNKTRTRGGTQCLGNMCGVGKTVKTAGGGIIKTVKRTVGKIIPH